MFVAIVVCFGWIIASLCGLISLAGFNIVGCLLGSCYYLVCGLYTRFGVCFGQLVMASHLDFAWVFVDCLIDCVVGLDTVLAY